MVLSDRNDANLGKKDIWIIFFWYFLLGILFVHLWELSSLPRGFFVDEAANGFNAILLAEQGIDDTGALWPIFFRSLGDYRGPLLIYMIATLFVIWQPSFFLVRFASFVYFCAFLGTGICLMRQMTTRKHHVFINLYMLCVIGLLPWFFTVSRISFAVNTLPFIFTMALIATWKTYEQHNNTMYWSLIGGIFTGLLLYTYQSGKFIAPVLLVLILAIYCRPIFWKRNLFFLLAYSVTSIPFLHFGITNPTAQLSRFKDVSYIYDDAILFKDKILQFIVTYLDHWSLRFLVLEGDRELRHSIGYAGQLYWVVFMLFCVGLVFAMIQLWKKRAQWKFILLLLIMTFMGTVPAAMTRPDVPHALRSIIQGTCIIFLSALGVDWILYALKSNRSKQLFISIMMGVLILESLIYLQEYFFEYPTRSADAFWNTYGMQTAIYDAAIKYRPIEIIGIDSSTDSFAFHNFRFYGEVIQKRTGIPISRLSLQEAMQRQQQSVCFISKGRDSTEIDTLESPLAREQHGIYVLHCFGEVQHVDVK